MKRSVGFSGSRIAPGTLVLEAVSEKPWSRFASRSDTVPEATSAATEQVDEVSGATESLEDTSAEGCLKCHGPFEALAGKTKDYVTEWDEKANPHMPVPHESSTIVECTECHAPHRLPYVEEPDAKKPGVGYCYACHHTESLVHCSQCHNE